MSSATDGVCYMGAPACELGQSRPVAELAESGESKEALDALRRLGLENYLRSDLSGAALMEASLRKTFASSPIAAEDIDFVLLATEHFDTSVAAESTPEPLRAFRRELFEAVARVGAVRAFPVGVTFAACGNFMSAVQLARCLTIAGAATNVLIAVVDRYPANLSRVVPRVAVMSDAAATCIVSSRPIPGFRIESFAQHATLNVNDVDMFTNFAAYTIEAARAMRKLGADFRKVSPGGFDAFKWLVTNNYTLSAIRGLLRQLGCDDKKAYVENVAKTSHCNAADIPINLASMVEGKILSPGDRVLGFGNGASAWALAGFTYVEGA
jgi:3-oxoacyl-[acyl-carrier-protein] synthase III